MSVGTEKENERRDRNSGSESMSQCCELGVTRVSSGKTSSRSCREEMDIIPRIKEVARGKRVAAVNVLKCEFTPWKL